MEQENEAQQVPERPCVRVAIRLRPIANTSLVPEFVRPCARAYQFQQAVAVSSDPTLLDPAFDDSTEFLSNRFKLWFDDVFDEHARQETLYLATLGRSVPEICRGAHATFLVYGQSGSGKTRTLEGESDALGHGVLTRVADDVFRYITACAVENRSSGQAMSLRIAALQIHNDSFADLLSTEIMPQAVPVKERPLKIREVSGGSIHVVGLVYHVVRTPATLESILRRARENQVALNKSIRCCRHRVHTIFTLSLEMEKKTTEKRRMPWLHGAPPAAIQLAKLNFVDLAASDHAHASCWSCRRATGSTEDSQRVARSFTALSAVLSAVYRDRSHIPYRDARLTHILKDTIGTGCFVYLVAHISSSAADYNETVNTLRFANSVKNLSMTKFVEEGGHRHEHGHGRAGETSEPRAHSPPPEPAAAPPIPARPPTAPKRSSPRRSERTRLPTTQPRSDSGEEIWKREIERLRGEDHYLRLSISELQRELKRAEDMNHQFQAELTKGTHSLDAQLNMVLTQVLKDLIRARRHIPRKEGSGQGREPIDEETAALCSVFDGSSAVHRTVEALCMEVRSLGRDAKAMDDERNGLKRELEKLEEEAGVFIDLLVEKEECRSRSEHERVDLTGFLRQSGSKIRELTLRNTELEARAAKAELEVQHVRHEKTLHPEMSSASDPPDVEALRVEVDMWQRKTRLWEEEVRRRTKEVAELDQALEEERKSSRALDALVQGLSSELETNRAIWDSVCEEIESLVPSSRSQLRRSMGEDPHPAVESTLPPTREHLWRKLGDVRHQLERMERGESV